MDSVTQDKPSWPSFGLAMKCSFHLELKFTYGITWGHEMREIAVHHCLSSLVKLSGYHNDMVCRFSEFLCWSTDLQSSLWVVGDPPAAQKPKSCPKTHDHGSHVSSLFLSLLLANRQQYIHVSLKWKYRYLWLYLVLPTLYVDYFASTPKQQCEYRQEYE